MKGFIASVLIIFLLSFVTSLPAIVAGQWMFVLMTTAFWVVVFILTIIIAQLLVD